jgi:hypothetical protein
MDSSLFAPNGLSSDPGAIEIDIVVEMELLLLDVELFDKLRRL